MTSASDSPSAYTCIRQAIIEGRYRPGQRLVEQRLASEFDLSRTPVREALRSLEAEGLIVSQPNRGGMVRPIAVRDVNDLYELRSRLESYAALRAARYHSAEQIERMDEAIVAFERAVPAAAFGDVEGLRNVHACNASFHQLILDGAKHERLAVLVRNATDEPLVYQSFRRFGEDDLRRSNLFHRWIRDAIAAGNEDRAERLMAEHIDQARDALLARLEGMPSMDALFDD
jgi:DNA-binding GntR family transcriptional regulator